MQNSLTAPAFSPERLARISAQVERLEARESEWARDTASPVEVGRTGAREAFKGGFGAGKVLEPQYRWDWSPLRANIRGWGDQIERLAKEMSQRAKQPFSLRTQQISVLCAFVPFVLAVLTAGLRFIPLLPSLQLWSKITWFVALPTFLAMAGALVGFIIGVMLDSVERQSEERSGSGSARDSLASPGSFPPGSGVKSSVWVAVDDLETDQRVAETVVGADGTPILLRHTLLKPTHLDLLKKQNVAKVKVETVKYPSEGDLAVAR
jgi:hypothetical protein